MRRLGMFRALKVQEESHLDKEDKRGSREELWRALSIKGMPRYLDGKELLLNPRITEMWH
jgi:hypothetical protein